MCYSNICIRWIEKKQTSKKCKIVGEYIKSELIKLSNEFPIISDVRGKGLFIGFELTTRKLKPLEKEAKYLINRMKEYGILMSSDGIDKNVIKVKPPLIFTKKNSNTLMFFLRKVLKEDVMKIQL